MSKAVNVKMVPTEEVVPYDKNPRLNDNAVDAVANSIREFGFKVPIVVDGDGVVISGHTRLKAAKALELTEVPVIVADDLDDTKIRAFRLADNKVAELADWDESLLVKELAELADMNYDMGQFEFDLEPELEDDDDLGDIPENINVMETFALNVIVSDEAEQAELYKEMLGRGYEVKVVAL
jgi:site-specific DNA-methyltransferase (adenine-specific)